MGTRSISPGQRVIIVISGVIANNHEFSLYSPLVEIHLLPSSPDNPPDEFSRQVLQTSSSSSRQHLGKRTHTAQIYERRAERKTKPEHEEEQVLNFFTPSEGHDVPQLSPPGSRSEDRMDHEKIVQLLQLQVSSHVSRYF